jgi:chromosome transmission fidelity protein 1
MMVGLPYPNRFEPELKEKMAYLNRRVANSKASAASGSASSSSSAAASVAATTGDRYYENLCMRAVNQSIGRSIRHRNDYAAILLFDLRYVRDLMNVCAIDSLRVCRYKRVRHALPSWIQSSFKECPKFGAVMEALGKFFAHKKKLQPPSH